MAMGLVVGDFGGSALATLPLALVGVFAAAINGGGATALVGATFAAPVFGATFAGGIFPAAATLPAVLAAGILTAGILGVARCESATFACGALAEAMTAGFFEPDFFGAADADLLAALPADARAFAGLFTDVLATETPLSFRRHCAQRHLRRRDPPAPCLEHSKYSSHKDLCQFRARKV